MDSNTNEILPQHWSLRYLAWPKTLLCAHVVLLALALFYSQSFGFDASSDTLVVEGDPDLAQYNEMVEVFGSDAFLFLTFEPTDKNPISENSIETLQSIAKEIAAVTGVTGVFSVLDAPLLKSPPVSLTELLENVPTLLSPGVDLTLARAELSQSPFFRELLITLDGTGTAMKIDLSADIVGQQRRAQLIADIRQVQNRYATKGTLYLGGVPMIASDMVAYVKRDLVVFGGVVIGLMIGALALFFRRPRWVVIPLITAGLAVLYTVGLLGALGWQATVISSNFVSLLGITTISLTIHLIVHYRELRHTQEGLTQSDLVCLTMREKFLPCLYTAITTIAAFGSLTVSGILPVEDFGWMMCVGIIVAFLTTYTVFPALLILLPKGKSASNLGKTNNLIRGLGEFVRWRPALVSVLGLVVAVLAGIGIMQVSLDNRFVDYFDESTEIHQGMRYIDENLGGTIPFDVLLKFEPFVADDGGFGDEDDDFSFGEPEEDPERYWYTRTKLDELEQVHRFLETKPHVGKVLSLTALEDFAKDFNEGRKLSNLEIVAVLGGLPKDLQSQVLTPYADPYSGQLRLSGRIIESAPSFDREEFRQEILQFGGELRFTEEIRVTGMMVLFNSMLSQLLSSQISTLAYILAIVFVMFIVLLRSIPHALLGLIPNSLASAAVIGAMGYSGIPLDMMTTTIAAICIGIGVDDTIHYLHRFRQEYARWGDPRVAVSFTHESIGRALFYTSLTVVAGFSVLGFSNFIPTVMFGLWTAVAMVLALVANLTLLPALLVLTHAKRPPSPELRSEFTEEDMRAAT